MMMTIYDQMLACFGLRRIRLAVSAEQQRLHDVLIEDWWPDRGFNERDYGSRRLLAATILAFPHRIHTRQACSCEDRRLCDECLDRTDVPHLIARARSILGLPPEGR